FVPDFSKDYLKSLMDNCPDANWPLEDGETAEQLYSKVSEILYTPEIAAKRVCQAAGKDHIVNSANNFYEGVTQAEVEAFYDAIRDKDDETPVSYGINSKVVKENGKVVEKVWKAGGMYGEAIEQIIFWLEKAKNVAEDDFQKESIVKLIEYYKTGNLNTWDDYNIAWVKDLSAQVDFVNGFIENYGDPMGMKATWESVVNFKDLEATKRAKIISENAQWFEDHSPVDEKFKKKEVKGVTAKVITVAQLGGDCYPSTPIGINLPNADWIRKEHGSKSVTMENITYAYDQASMGSGYMEEFAFSQEIIDRAKKYGALAGNLHTDLHECLGHGSGQLLPGVNPEALRSYGSALEETRADLFALYYLLDDRMVELGLMPSLEVAKAEYDNYISNGIMWQLKRVKPGADIEQAHMRNRQLIAKWTYENGLADSVISKIQKEGKTYFVINDYNKLRELFGKLLAEVQRIKSEGDYEAGKDLVEKYAVKVDQDLHAEMLDRYAKLNLAPYGGFMNPVLKPIEENGEIKNVVVEYPDDYTEQMLWYSEDYSPLPTYN
ncbi:MAG: dihydrofolate reductase, partial [Marinilabiliales bacterium]